MNRKAKTTERRSILLECVREFDEKEDWIETVDRPRGPCNIKRLYKEVKDGKLGRQIYSHVIPSRLDGGFQSMFAFISWTHVHVKYFKAIS